MADHLLFSSPWSATPVLGWDGMSGGCDEMACGADEMVVVVSCNWVGWLGCDVYY